MRSRMVLRRPRSSSRQPTTSDPAWWRGATLLDSSRWRRPCKTRATGGLLERGRTEHFCIFAGRHLTDFPRIFFLRDFLTVTTGPWHWKRVDRSFGVESWAGDQALQTRMRMMIQLTLWFMYILLHIDEMTNPSFIFASTKRLERLEPGPRNRGG